MHLEEIDLYVKSDEKSLFEIHPLTPVTEQKALNYLYIGNDDAHIYAYSNKFQSGILAGSFVQAQVIIESLLKKESVLPDLILIDILPDQTAFNNFCLFLKENLLNVTTVVIYNEKLINAQNVKFLRKCDFVDDILDFEDEGIDYETKVAFLKKLKLKHKLLREKYALSQKHFKKIPNSFTSKRLFDIVVSLILITLLLPVFLTIALIIAYESKGPIIYTSLRAGKGFRIFKFYKFRTMEANADKKIEALSHLNQYQVDNNGPCFFKIDKDPRITKFGRVLRNSSLDELPQLFNVLLGDMSLVGNRPLPLYEASTLTTNEFVERFMAPAGITGLWQVQKRGKKDMSAKERISLDISYAKKSNLLFDLWIMVQTPTALFQKNDV